MRTHLGEVSSELERAVAGRMAADEDANRLRSERELLKDKLANATGQAQAMSKQVEVLSRHLSQGRKATPAASQSTVSATISTKNNKA